MGLLANGGGCLDGYGVFECVDPHVPQPPIVGARRCVVFNLPDSPVYARSNAGRVGSGGTPGLVEYRYRIYGYSAGGLRGDRMGVLPMGRKTADNAVEKAGAAEIFGYFCWRKGGIGGALAASSPVPPSK